MHHLFPLLNQISSLMQLRLSLILLLQCSILRPQCVLVLLYFHLLLFHKMKTNIVLSMSPFYPKAARGLLFLQLLLLVHARGGYKKDKRGEKREIWLGCDWGKSYKTQSQWKWTEEAANLSSMRVYFERLCASCGTGGITRLWSLVLLDRTHRTVTSNCQLYKIRRIDYFVFSGLDVLYLLWLVNGPLSLRVQNRGEFLIFHRTWQSQDSGSNPAVDTQHH